MKQFDQHMIHHNGVYNPRAMRDWMWTLQQVLLYNYSGERGWHAREQRKYGLHEAVYRAVDLACPDDWQQLVLEWPHASESDPTRLAYTRDDRKGVDNVQTITTIGKYLARHFSRLKDNQIRDIAALYAATGCEIVTTMDEMLDTIQNGPQSCMKWSNCHVENHPYRVYNPKYGWAMARRVVGGDVIGRALVYADDRSMCFVRSYRKTDGYSPSDEILEAWLVSQGYTHESGWPEGARLEYIDGNGLFIAPYIDGDVQNVDVRRDSNNERYLRITDGGEYTCNCTNGYPEEEEDEDMEYCADCDSHEHSEDMYWVGEYDDRHVCSSCREAYHEAVSRGGRMLVLHQDDVTWVESMDRYYDDRYMSDNGIIELENGEYEHIDNAWCCEHSNEWYHTDEDSVVVKDEYGNDIQIHPDYADQYETETENEGE